MIVKGRSGAFDDLPEVRCQPAICSNKKIERDDDSKKSHPALGPKNAKK
jgi:hypothetical protein